MSYPAGAKLTDVEKITLQSEMNNFISRTDTYNREKLPFFTFMLEHVSEHSKTILMRSDDFNKMVLDKDVLNMWKLIVSSHSVMNGGNKKVNIPGEIDRQL